MVYRDTESLSLVSTPRFNRYDSIRVKGLDNISQVTNQLLVTIHIVIHSWP